MNARCTRGASDTALCMVDPATLSPTDEHQRLRMERFLNTRARPGRAGAGVHPAPAGAPAHPRDRRPRDPDDARVAHRHRGRILSHDLDDDDFIDPLDSDPADIFVVGSTRALPALTGAHVINVGSVGQAPGGEVAHFTILNPRLDGTEILRDFVTF
ncbi:MAG: hypothetical protein IPG81_27620 [Sandaracinaceae bacterium]|nr:hypothetical protein [Sandaracinaceae bacterium]